MKLTIALILLLTMLAILSGCDPKVNNILGKPQAFLFGFSEPMNPETALDSSNYLIINSITNDTVEVGSVRFAKSVQINDSTWKQLPMSQYIALYPAKPIYAGSYYVELWDLEDEAGNVIEPNPTQLKLKYEPRELKVE